MKHLSTFEKWSSTFNRTLQGAYAKAKDTGKGFGKSAKSILDYANRSISKKVFKIVTKSEKEIEIVHNPEFILKPIETFKKYNGELSKNKRFIVIPIKFSQSELSSRKDKATENFDLVFKDGKIYGFKTERVSSSFPTGSQGGSGELRFLSRVDIEDFFAMVIQAVLSSPEESSDIAGWNYPDKNLPGDTTEKQIILGLIQNLILDKDSRQYTM